MAWYFWGNPTFPVSISSYSFRMAEWQETWGWGTVLKCLAVVLVRLVKIINCCFSLLSPTLLFFFFSLSMSSLLCSPLLSLSASLAGTPCHARGAGAGCPREGLQDQSRGVGAPSAALPLLGTPWPLVGLSQTIQDNCKPCCVSQRNCAVSEKGQFLNWDRFNQELIRWEVTWACWWLYLCY